ncbi:MAG TPA: serine hydrolase [Pyrinomonadaceae bacterium]|nr:serine hydrolase [Pyrinomonadaceae bacterium]
MSKKINVVNHLTALVWLCLIFTLYVSAQNAAPPSAQQITAKVDEYMNAAMRVDGFSGSILIARNGQPIVSKGYGMANVEHAVPNAPQTVFRLASITKQFTAMAIVMLQERGKLNVGDSICKYFSDCPAAWQSVTVKHLLTHTSGVPSYTSFPDFAKNAVLPTTAAGMIAQLRDKPLDSPPGEKYAYNNSGYFLLGLIIERVSGKSYADFLQENIFTPLGMKQTGYDSPRDVIKNRASGYARQGGEIFNASYMDMTVPGAAGALFSTTEDMLRWDQALYTENLVSNKSLGEIHTPFKNGYGYGWSIGKRFDRQIIAHGGNIFGFATQIARYPADRLTVIVLSNVEGAPAGRIANDLAAIVFGAPYEIPQERKEIAVEPKILEKYVGEYQIKQPKIVIVITLENGKLLAQVAGQSKIALSAEAEDRFFSKDVNLLITFVKDAQGKVTGLTLRQGGGNFPAQKIK